MGKGNKNVKRVAMMLAVCLMIYLIIDYCNPFAFFKINILRINTDFLAIVVNNIVVVSIAIFTFIFIDRRQIQKHINQEDVAKFLLKMTYEMCESNVSIFDDESFVKELKAKAYSLDVENNPVRKIEKSAFENEQLIMDAFMNGTLSKEIVEDYFAMKKAYSFCMTVGFFYYDHPKLYEREKNKFINCYREGLARLEGSKKVSDSNTNVNV